MPDISMLKPLSVELGITVSELIEGERRVVADKISEKSLDQIIEYTVQSREHNVVLWNDINFITTVVCILTIVLLVIGVVLQRLMLPLMILGILLVLCVIRIALCKCPGCGKILPYSLGKAKLCPHCGLKLVREEK